jgi:tetratricopeptide (TPR) repeat protein
VSAALLRCLRALGVPDTYIPAALDERVGLYRQHTSDRRILVVLDDVTQPAQISSLLPAGPGSALLVTSTGRLGELALDGARLVPLEPLDPAGALELLTDRCGAQAVAAEPRAARRIAELCGGVPVALQLAAARLLTTGGLTLGRLADELADESRRLAGLSLGEEHSVSAVLGVVYADLPPGPARLYRLLGLLPAHPFDTGTAAAAAGLDPATARAHLTALERVHLVTATGDDRYRLHSLVRLHARERAAAEEPDGTHRAVITRVTVHYLVLTAWADRSIRSDRLRIADLDGLLDGTADPFGGDGPGEGPGDRHSDGPGDGLSPLDWLAAERAAVMAVLREAAALGLHRLVAPLAEAFTVLFLHHRYLHDWRESLETGAASAAATGDTALEARLRSLLSRPLMDLGRYDDAHTELRRAVDLARAAGLPALQGSVQEFLGRYYDHSDPPRAEEAYRRSLAFNTEAEEWRGAALALYFLGCAQDAAGRHAEALETLRTARHKLLERSDVRMAARALAAVGVAQAHLGDRAAAVASLAEAAEALREQRAHHYEAGALVHLADLTGTGAGDGDTGTVRGYLTRALEIHEAGGSPEAEVLRRRLAELDGEG